MEPLKPSNEIMPLLDIKPGMRMAFIGDIDYYSKDIIEVAQPLKEPHYFSLKPIVPLPDGSVDFIFAWLLKDIRLDIMMGELTRICSPTGTIWIVMWNMKDMPPNIPNVFSATSNMSELKWESAKEVLLSKDYLAIKYMKKK